MNWQKRGRNSRLWPVSFLTNMSTLNSEYRFCHDISVDVLSPSVLWHCWLDGRKGMVPVKYFFSSPFCFTSP